MLAFQVVIALFALSVPVIGLVVAARLLASSYRAIVASRLGLAALSVAGVVLLAALLAAVFAIWFAYGVAHSEKGLSSDVRVMLLTGAPFYLASYGLWRLAGRVRSRLLRQAEDSRVAKNEREGGQS